MRDDAALVLFSGGQDSTTCLAWALDRFALVETIGFDYGQRHRAELDARTRIRKQLPAGADHVLALPVLADLRGMLKTDDNRPSTFIPGRNLIFLAYAGALAYRRDIRHLVGGMCETDYSGYPDCRDDAIKAMGLALNIGMDVRLVVHTPLMWLDKAATWQLAEELGGRALVDLIVEDTHTCYNNSRTQRHAWGYGCADCPACRLRAAGFSKYTSGSASSTIHTFPTT